MRFGQAEMDKEVGSTQTYSKRHHSADPNIFSAKPAGSPQVRLRLALSAWKCVCRSPNIMLVSSMGWWWLTWMSYLLHMRMHTRHMTSYFTTHTIVHNMNAFLDNSIWFLQTNVLEFANQLTLVLASLPSGICRLQAQLWAPSFV